MNVVRRNRALDGRETVADLGGGYFSHDFLVRG